MSAATPRDWVSRIRTLKPGIAIWVVGYAVLAGFWLGVVLTLPYTAEEATLLLAAKAMMQGNLLLRGWTLIHIPWYTTELPLFIAGLATMGLTWRVIYAAAALTWAAIALLIVWLSCKAEDGSVTPSKVIVALALTLYLPGAARSYSLITNAHLPALVYSLITLACIQKIQETGSRAWYAIYASALTLALVGDGFALYLIPVPVIAVCVFRMLTPDAGRTTRSLLVVTVLASVLAAAIVGLIEAAGGASFPGVPAVFTSLADLPDSIYRLVEGLLILFRVGFLGKPVASMASVFGLLHLTGLLLFAVAFWMGARKFSGLSLAPQVLIAVIAVNLAANVFSSVAGTPRYLWPTVIFGAILASRFVFAARAFATHRIWVVAGFVVLALSLMPRLSYAKPQSPGDDLARMLVRLGLVNGYGPYWRANNTTVASAGQAAVRAVYLDSSGRMRPYYVLSDKNWYEGYADFLVVDANDKSGLHPTLEQAISIFGEPAQIHELYEYGYLVVWDHDITPQIVR